MQPDNPFLRVILDHPEDDAPRLIYADWLEEHGHATPAEFLRLECTLARMPEGAREFAALHQRFWELRGQVDVQWTASLGVRTFLLMPTPTRYHTLRMACEAESPRVGIKFGLPSIYVQVKLRAEPWDQASIVVEDCCPALSTRSDWVYRCLDGIRNVLIGREDQRQYWCGLRIKLLSFNALTVPAVAERYDRTLHTYRFAAGTAFSQVLADAALTIRRS